MFIEEIPQISKDENDENGEYLCVNFFLGNLFVKIVPFFLQVVKTKFKNIPENILFSASDVYDENNDHFKEVQVLHFLLKQNYISTKYLYF